MLLFWSFSKRVCIFVLTMGKWSKFCMLYTDTIKKCPLFIYVNLLKTNVDFFIQLFCFKKCDYVTMLCAKTKFIRCSFTATTTPQAPVLKLRKSHNQYLACLTTAAHLLFQWMDQLSTRCIPVFTKSLIFLAKLESHRPIPNGCLIPNNPTYFMSQVMRKRVLCHMRTTKAQISLRIRAVWSAPLLFTA